MAKFSQLYQAPWIDAVRATVPGRLVLGIQFMVEGWNDDPQELYAVSVVRSAI